MSDESILSRISELVEEEHQLRGQLLTGKISEADEHTRLQSLEEALDQCWDLLRRRRAARTQGEDPESVQPRPTAEVEGYVQ